MYFAVPFFGVGSDRNPWWLIGVLGALVTAFIYGRELWRRALGTFFLISVFLPWGWLGGWVIGYGLTMLIDGFRVQEKARQQREEIEALQDEGCDGRS
jgi:hypothetical protein